jgi:hypothetical protein
MTGCSRACQGRRRENSTTPHAAVTRPTLLAFCQSAYEAGARLAGWDTASFESTWCPTPDQLQQLRANAAAEFGRTKDEVR